MSDSGQSVQASIYDQMQRIRACLEALETVPLMGEILQAREDDVKGVPPRLAKQIREEAATDANCTALVKCAHMLVDFRAVRDRVTNLKTSMEHLHGYIAKGLCVDAADDAGITSAKISGLGTFMFNTDVYVKKTGGDMNAWLQATGNADLIKTTVNAASLKKVLKDAEAEGVDVSEVAELTHVRTATIRKN